MAAFHALYGYPPSAMKMTTASIEAMKK